MDEQLTTDIQSWLNTEHTSADMIIKGATLLLALNRNQVLYGNILRTPSRPMWVEKLEYELNKYLKIRLAGLTRTKVIQLDHRVTSEATEILKEGTVDETDEKDVKVNLRGKRADHDSLPQDIQNLWTFNASRWKKIRLLHATLRKMENAESCDRYEYLTQLDELDKKYRSDMQKYDEYSNPQKNIDTGHVLNEHGIIDNEESSDDAIEDEDPLENVDFSDEDKKKALHKHGQWFSRNIPKLEAMKAKEDPTEVEKQAYEQLTIECQQHINQWLSLGGRFNPTRSFKLRKIGLKVTLEDA